MTCLSHHLLSAALALVLATAPQGIAAQEVVQPIPGTTDADRLGDTMRQLASNPRNVDALVRAGELSLGLGDLSGAAALFARAEKVDPRNGRMKAGMASILVRSERPGEALRYFAQAEMFGLQPRYFASDRGLAYDLIGEQDRAQRDYRVALRDASDDETIRRYALSLGISGKRDLALKQLDPLVLKKDRGAWRARAFILAMSNDQRGAETIVTTMMPGAAAQGLQPFFQRLPTLSPADRAFAVHFGEVHTTPQRIADARLTPTLPVLGVDPTAPVMLAQVQPEAAPQAAAGANRGKRDKSRDRRGRSAPGRVALATAAPVAATPPATLPAVQVASRTSTPSVTGLAYPASNRSVSTLPTGTGGAGGVPLAGTQPRTDVRAQQQGQSSPVRTSAPVQLASAAPATTSNAPTSTVNSSTGSVAQVAATPAPVFVQPLPTRPPVTVAAASAGTLPDSVTAQMRALPAPASETPIVSRAGATMVSAAPVVARQTPATPATTVPAPGFTTAAPVELATNTRPAARAITASEDSILARIIAGLSIPASELDVAPPARPPASAGEAAGAVPVSEDGARVLAEAKAKADRDSAAERVAAEAATATRLAEAKTAKAKLVAEKKAADKKALADKKLLAEKKEAAEKKAIADKEAAEEKRIARANPERIWVQVSTGATEGDLPKAWKGVKAKAPAVVGTRGGWTTPWRATNRVLAGPFKTTAEARTFVNALAKEGISTFSFTSDAGQVITKLPAK